MAAKKRGLGKGLEVLLGAHSSETVVEQAGKTVLTQIPLDLLQRGKYQPRQDMHNEALEELAQSIKKQGVMQPIVVRPVGRGRYEIIAGERRWRASQVVGLDVIPAIIREVPDEAAIAMSLIENIQREDLNPIEEAVSLQRLQKEFELTQQQIAEAVGKSRSTVTNLLRLITLAEPVKKLLEHGDLEMGHAKALLSLKGELQTSTARTVADKGLSVRQTESLIRQLTEEKNSQGEKIVDPNIIALEAKISESLGAKVSVQANAKGKGKLTIHYNSLDELDGILAHIN